MGLKTAIKFLLRALPKQDRLYVEQSLRWLRQRGRAKPYFGEGRVCACCGRHWREYVPAGKPVRPGELCLRCGGGRRQRLMAHFLTAELKDRPQTKLLHFAPEVSLTRPIRRLHNVDYMSVDIVEDVALMKADIQNLPFGDAEFDVIVCSHVLEHIPDDARAMGELHRVLRQDGVAYVMVPQDFDRDTTFEDHTITDPIERERAFGQDDHVRMYGRDFTDRLARAGFDVQSRRTHEIADPETVRLGDLRDEVIYVCRPTQESAP
jgi:SAM-dependent methyltransferase